MAAHFVTPNSGWLTIMIKIQDLKTILKNQEKPRTQSIIIPIQLYRAQILALLPIESCMWVLVFVKNKMVG